MSNFIVVAFIVISFIGWVINQVNAQNKPPARRGRPQRGNRRVQEEIDDFLREATGNRKPGGRVLSADEIEIVDESQARRPPPRRPAPTRPSTRQKPGSNVSNRHLSGHEELGSSVRDHVRTHMDERVSAGAEEHLAHDVDQHVSQHLGAFSAGMPTSSGRTAQSETRRRRNPRTTALLAALRTPVGVRNAVLMQEILGRPRSLRNRDL